MDRHSSTRRALGGVKDPSVRRRLAIDPDLQAALALATAPRGDEAHAEGAENDYGLDLDFREQIKPIFRFLFESYWRVDVHGIDNVPHDGPVLLVGNHSGGLPFDATMVAYALDNHEQGPRRVARPLYDRFVKNFGPIDAAYRKAGGAPARYSVADELLLRGEMVVNFPEGVDGVAKLYDQRYQLQDFSTSAARLSIRHRIPVVPFAVIGAEEIYPVIGRSEKAGEALGTPFVPITPFFPLLGMVGTVPLPTKWTIVFGKRIYLSRERRFRGAGATDFEAMTARLRRAVQGLVTRQLRRRSSIFFG
jgi:1-acyl-sn-glycerol-3-phosphate acyltransferase